MSKQYLTTHTVDNAHTTDIFSLAGTPTALLSASGASFLRVHSTTDPSFPLTQTIENAHRLGCHHVVTSRGGPGRVAASAGFGGDVKVWTCNPDTGDWNQHMAITPDQLAAEGAGKAGDLWAIALSTDEQYLAMTNSDGRIHVWDIVEQKRIQTYETGGGAAGGSFGMSVDLSRDGKYTASGHQDGRVYVFNNDAGRLIYSLSGLAKPIRAVAFSPGCTRLAAAGDAGIIALYDIKHGEHVGNLSAGHANSAWITSIDWSETGEYLLSGSLDGRARVWSIDRGECVATHSETSDALWAARWLPKSGTSADAHKSERFCTAGANRSISFYREATGG